MKPTIMILGSGHLANPGKDRFNFRMDDVLADRRQREIEQLISQLKPFRPNKIGIQADQRFEAEINANYQNYLKDRYKLKRWEGEQIGFRLAKQMEHPKVYCIDYAPEQDPFFLEDLDKDLIDVDKFAMENDQEHLLPKIEDFSFLDDKIKEEDDGRFWIESQKYESLINMYIRDNDPEGRRAEHKVYLRTAKVGLDDHYPGANWVGHQWYTRNLKIYVNLTRITKSDEDRILIIFGTGLIYLVQKFLVESGDYIVESPLKYLKTEDNTTSN